MLATVAYGRGDVRAATAAWLQVQDQPQARRLRRSDGPRVAHRHTAASAIAGRTQATVSHRFLAIDDASGQAPGRCAAFRIPECGEPALPSSGRAGCTVVGRAPPLAPGHGAYPACPLLR
jgi:hypothetical protein